MLVKGASVYETIIQCVDDFGRLDSIKHDRQSFKGTDHSTDKNTYTGCVGDMVYLWVLWCELSKKCVCELKKKI